MRGHITSGSKAPARHFLHTTAKLQYALPSALDGTLMRWDDGRCYWRDGERDGYIVDLLNRDRFDFRVIQLFGNEVVEFPEFICLEPDSWPELAEHGMLTPLQFMNLRRAIPGIAGANCGHTISAMRHTIFGPGTFSVPLGNRKKPSVCCKKHRAWGHGFKSSTFVRASVLPANTVASSSSRN